MFPRWHIIFGSAFSLLVWLIFPFIGWYKIAIIFLASILIDFDHYVFAVWKTGKFGLFEVFEYHRKLTKKAEAERKKGIYRKGDFHVFHTIEFHALVLTVGLIFSPFFYIFIGMLFHSVLDLIYILFKRELHRREFFLTCWTRRKIKKSLKFCFGFS